MKIFSRILKLKLLILNLILLNIRFLFIKILNKKVVVFYHPHSNLKAISQFYLTNLFKFKNKNIKIFFLHQDFYSNNKNYFIIDRGLRFLYGIDIFVSNYITIYFPYNSRKVYIHHDIYDTPLVSKSHEQSIVNRLASYHYILVPSISSKKMFSNFFLKNSQKPKILIMGYFKLDYLITKKNNYKKKENIVIAPTNFKANISFSCLKYIEKIIIYLLSNTNYKIVLRPHPSNVKDQEIININQKFIWNKRFVLDTSSNYTNTYFASRFMISDFSGTAYTYAFLTKNPVIFFSPNETLLNKTYNKDLNFFSDRKKIGIVVDKIPMLSKINNLLRNKSKYKFQIKKLMNSNIKVGNSKVFFEKFIEQLLRNKEIIDKF